MIVGAAVILVFTVIGLLVYSRNYSNKKVEESTAALRHELEMIRLRNQNANQARKTSGNDNPAFTKN